MRQISGVHRNQQNKRKKYAIEIPGSWEELSPEQFGAAIYMLIVTTKADPLWIRLSLLTLLFNKNYPILEGLSKLDRYTLMEECCRFFYETEPPLQNFHPTLKDLIPCNPDLSNISFGEWCFLATYFNYYQEFKDQKWLIRMIATVYRPRNPQASEDNPDYTGDLRQEFNENLIVKRAETLSDLEETIQTAIFQWLCIAMQKVKEMRPEIFPIIQPARDEDGNPIASLMQNNKDQGSWIEVFNDLIGPKFGTPEQLKKTNAMLVLDYLNKEQKTYKSLGL